MQDIVGSQPGRWTVEQAITGIAQEAAKGIANPEWRNLGASALLLYTALTEWYRINPVKITPNAKLAGDAGLLGQGQYLELIESEGLEYSQKAFSENLKPLTSVERQEQRKKIEEQLLFSDSGTPHISTYDIRDFVY